MLPELSAMMQNRCPLAMVPKKLASPAPPLLPPNPKPSPPLPPPPPAAPSESSKPSAASLAWAAPISAEAARSALASPPADAAESSRLPSSVLVSCSPSSWARPISAIPSPLGPRPRPTGIKSIKRKRSICARIAEAVAIIRSLFSPLEMSGNSASKTASRSSTERAGVSLDAGTKAGTLTLVLHLGQAKVLPAAFSAAFKRLPHSKFRQWKVITGLPRGPHILCPYRPKAVKQSVQILFLNWQNMNEGQNLVAAN